MKKTLTFVFGLIISVSMTSIAMAAPVAQKAAPVAVATTPKSCPKGWLPLGEIAKITIAKNGIVTEFIRLQSGEIQKMPAFKATKAYVNKVGDPYCFDSTPDND